MTYETVLHKSREVMGPYCKSCPICNGKACRNQILVQELKVLVKQQSATTMHGRKFI